MSVSTSSSGHGKKSRRNGDGTTFFDSKRNRWVSSFYDINGKRRTQTFHKRGDAETWRINNISIRDKGGISHPEDPKQTLEEYLTHWINSRKSFWRPNTTEFYEKACRNLISPYMGKEKAATLRPATIEETASKLLSSGYSAGSLKAFYSTLSKAFNDGVRLGWLPNNPIARVERLRLHSNPTPPIPQSDVEKLFMEALKSERDMARLIVGVRLGLRPAEVSGLRWEDLDLTNKSLQIKRQVQYCKENGLAYCPPKTLRKAPIPLTDNEISILVEYRKVQDSLWERWEARAAKNGYVIDRQVMFPNSYGTLQNSKSDTKWFHELCQRAEVNRYQRYQMRKKAFTDLLLVADLGTTMTYSGHSQSSTLIRHYISPELSAVRSAVEKREIHNSVSGVNNLSE